MEEIKSSANEALCDAQFEKAIDKYSKVLDEFPEDIEALLGRSQAYLMQEEYLDALSDAKKVLELDPTNAKACYRKAVACYEMDELETAMNALHNGLKNTAGEVVLANKMEKLLETCQNALHPESQKGDQNTEDNQQSQQPPPPPKYRHQHYQTPQAMNVDVFAKKLIQERLKIKFSEDSLSIVINSPEGDPEFELSLDLYAPIVPSESKFQILRTKVEICMRKKDGDLQWPTLEKSEKIASNNFSKEEGASRGYPSSAKSKKNWESLDKEGKELEENEKPEGDAAVQSLFQKIYAGADEDTRRAMMKSFQESNGTVLSTNWKEVGEKKVECTPPDGMEVRKFEQ